MRRGERGQAGVALLMLVAIVGLAFVISEIGNRGWQDYRVDAVACDKQHPITFTDHATFTTNSDADRVLTSRPDCVELTWHWVDGGFHWKEHVALIGRFRIYEKAADQ